MSETIRALSRGLNVMKILSATGGASCQRIADELNLSRPTVHRILVTLIDEGLVAVDEGKTFRCAVASRSLQNGLTDKAWALWSAVSTLVELQKEVVWTCEIATFENYAMMLQDSMHHENPFKIEVREFDDRPRSMLTSAHGQAYLAFCPENEAEHILSHLETFGDRMHRKTQVNSYTRSRLRKIREQGYALEQRIDYPHVTVIAVPIRHENRVLGCVGIAWMTRAIKLQGALDQFLGALKRAQAEIEDKLKNELGDWHSNPWQHTAPCANEMPSRQQSRPDQAFRGCVIGTAAVPKPAKTGPSCHGMPD